MKRIIQQYWKALLLVLLIVGILFYFCLPKYLFNDPYSTLIEDKNNNLLNAAIAADGQWRFPEQLVIPDKFKEAIIAYEDKRFYYHPGVDILSLGRAIKQNSKAGKIVSGASTLTMQVIRLSRKVNRRTLFEKLIEMILSTRLELRCSKNEILSFYASHAPFGGNVVGVEAACWRYFGRGSKDLSWGEAAMLAVLPNNPSLIHLSKNRNKLKVKRDKLLYKLFINGKFDQLTYNLAMSEPIPEAPVPLPQHAPHLLSRVKAHHSNQKITTTIDLPLQIRVNAILNDHYKRLKGNQIFNAAALVVEVSTGNVLAYVGNVASGVEHQENVDVVAAPRSTGSILKPFLYAAMLDDGKMLPKTLQPDIPLVINGFSPKNFSKQYDGAVPADQALIRSLNVPAVNELRNYKYERFYELLKSIGLTTLKKPSDHYGLSLILGGAEGTLWDITGAYASTARTLNNFFEHPGKNKYRKSDFHSLTYRDISNEQEARELEETSWLSASAAYLTFEALQEVYRPGEETGWRYFNNSKRIAWKTGTSHGFRDGWAVGLSPDYVVGIWVGNADGEGRPGLTGTETAAPILFDVFSLLPKGEWFSKPEIEMEEVPVCSRSGYRVSSLCEKADTLWIPKTGLGTPACPYHKKIHLTKDLKYQVHSGCEDVSKMQSVNWFILPAIQEYYYKVKNINYQSVPPFKKGCVNSQSLLSMDIIYPNANSKIFIPRNLDGTLENVIFEATHRNPDATIYWHFDSEFQGTTHGIHKIAIRPKPGSHKLTLIDDKGEIITREFKIL